MPYDIVTNSGLFMLQFRHFPTKVNVIILRHYVEETLQRHIKYRTV